MGLIEAIKKYNLTNPISNVENSDAFTYFLNNGIPTNKNEEWKYTSLKKVINKEYIIENSGEKIDPKAVEKYSLQFKNTLTIMIF